MNECQGVISDLPRIFYLFSTENISSNQIFITQQAELWVVMLCSNPSMYSDVNTSGRVRQQYAWHQQEQLPLHLQTHLQFSLCELPCEQSCNSTSLICWMQHWGGNLIKDAFSVCNKVKCMELKSFLRSYDRYVEIEPRHSLECCMRKWLQKFWKCCFVFVFGFLKKGFIQRLQKKLVYQPLQRG